MLPTITALLALFELSSSGRAFTCAKIAGTEGLLKRGHTVMLGEVHGTEEIPQFTADLACLALQRQLRVTVALEIEDRENERFARYLSSAGGSRDRAHLESGAHWQVEIPDGRSSKAMIDLLERLRQLRAKGGKVSVFGLMNHRLGDDREVVMARLFVRHRRADPDGFFVVLAGGNHVRVRPGDDMHQVKWMGQHIVEAGIDRLVSLKAISRPGQFFQSSRSPLGDFPGRDYGTDRFIRLGPWVPGHDGVFHVVTLTPSYPVSRRAGGDRR